MKIKCIVVDDSQSDLIKIKRVLMNSVSFTQLHFDVHYFDNPTDDHILQQTDFYILDIDMPGMNGFQLANRIYETNPKATIAFCTNHDDLVFDSFKLNAFYFIRKSFLEEDLFSALRKYVRQYSDDKAAFVINDTEQIKAVPIRNIVYFEVSHNDLYIHTVDKEYRLRKSMKQLLDEFHHNSFIQIDQNFLINCSFIQEIKDSIIILSTGQTFTVPRRNIKQVKDQYISYLSR